MKIEKVNGHDFLVKWEDQYCSLSYNSKMQLAVCRAEKEYIPIRDFKNTFQEISANLDNFPVQHLIFDKRHLRTFDQPSMEWYFAIWKPEVKKKGLVNHYKILPELLWFKKAVEAGKNEIFQKYSPGTFEGISVKYVQDIPEVLKMIQSK